jgi:hypothetical protein
MLKRFASFALILAFATAASAQQQTADRVGTFNDWSVYTAVSATGRVCFAVSQPIETAPTGVNRDAIYFMLSTWPATGIRNEAFIIIGYPFATDSTVTVTIDNTDTFEFFTGNDTTNNDAAWLRDLGQEGALVVAMQRGAEMVVRGRSQRGTDTTDRYSLRGVTAALSRVAQECP